MTIRNGLFFENNKTGQHAQDVRLMLKALLGGVTGRAGGVVGVDALKVTEKAGTPDMSVDVAPGHFFIEGSRNSAQGTYHGYNDATINVPLSASDPSNPRIDIIYIRAEDSQYDAGFDTLDMFSQPRVAEGTPAAVPDPPTITDEDYIELARVTVGAGVSAIEDADIEDVRTFVGPITPRPPSVSLTRGSPQSIPNNTWTNISWGTENWDTHGLHSTTSNTDRVTVDRDGIWRINARCGFATNSTGFRAMRLLLNGSTIIDYWNVTSPGSTDAAMMALNRELELDEGDFIEVQVWQNSGGSLNLDAAVGLPLLEVDFVRPTP